MRADDFVQLLRSRPFQPFRIHSSDGQTYDIRHPDQLIVLRSRIVVGVGSGNGVAEHLEHLSLLHVVRVEEIEAETRDPSD
jgi:hypothetical protein